jgi:glycosyl transferase, family 25
MTSSSWRTPCPVFCINLNRSVDRRRHMERQFRGLGLTAQFIDATDGRGLDLSAMQKSGLLHPQNEGISGLLTAAEVACCISHERAWRQVVEGAYRYALVCEDDASFAKSLDLLSLIRCVPLDADLVYLHYTNDASQNRISPAIEPGKDVPRARFGGYGLYRAWACGGTLCYLVTARGAKRLIAQMRPIRYPSDGFMARLTGSGDIRSYATHPMMASWAGFDSTIR